MDCTASRPQTRFHNSIISFFGVIVLTSLVLISSLTTSGNVADAVAPLAKPEAAYVSAGNNNTDNPDIYIDCTNPSLTVSLLLDRSGSVARDSRKKYGDPNKAPTIFKDTVKLFVQKLHDEIASRGGKVDVYIYAFSTLTVLQNPDVSAGGARLTDISTQANVDKMKTAIDRIYFNEQYSKDENYPGEDSGSAEAYDIARGYNAKGYHISPNGQTNWDDPLLETANLASSTDNSSDIGGHFDLTLMLTDGMPNLYNGDNPRHIWKSDAPWSGSKPRTYPAEVVTKLRTGQDIGPYDDRSPVSVKGIFINPEIGTGSEDEQDAIEAMDEVFGRANYTTANNFEKDLKGELDKIVAAIANDSNCNGIDYVVPILDLRINRSSINLYEGAEPGTPVTVTLRNISTSPLAVLQDVYITMYYNGPDGPYEARIYVGTLKPGETFTLPLYATLEMGQQVPDGIIFIARGTFVETETIKLDPNSPYATTEPIDIVTLGVNIIRVDLPA